MKFSGTIILTLAIALAIYSCKTNTGVAVEQTPIARVEQMPDLPQPLKSLTGNKRHCNSTAWYLISATQAGAVRSSGSTVHDGISTRLPMAYIP
jgi:hypothetical protein